MSSLADYLAPKPQPPDQEPPDRNIYADGRAPKVDQKAIFDFVFKGKGWRDAALRLRDQQEQERAERKARRSLELAPIPEAEFDPIEEYE